MAWSDYRTSALSVLVPVSLEFLDDVSSYLDPQSIFLSGYSCSSSILNFTLGLGVKSCLRA